MLGRRIALVVALVSLRLAAGPATALAQDEGYAWGEEAQGSSDAPPGRDDPLRIMGFVGAGAGFRLLRNLDPPFLQEFTLPVYVDLAGAVYLPGRDVRHGAGLALSTNVTAGASTMGVGAFRQWVITPSYQLLLPLRYLLDDMDEDMLQIQLRVGVPLVLGQGLDNTAGVDFTFGGEIAAAFHYKFLAGLGIYLEVQGDLIGGALDPSGNPTLHPSISADAGFLIDYEVLP